MSYYKSRKTTRSEAAVKILPRQRAVPKKVRQKRPTRTTRSPGRPRGSGNIVTRDIRKGFTFLLEGNLDKMQAWLNRVARKDPGRALDALFKMAEFCVPKLNRIEHTGEGADDMARLANALTAGIIGATDSAAAAALYQQLMETPLPALEHAPQPVGDDHGKDQAPGAGERPDEHQP